LGAFQSVFAREIRRTRFTLKFSVAYWPKPSASARLRPLGFGAASFSRYRERRMVGTTGIEPVTPTMSRFAAPAYPLDFGSHSFQLVTSGEASFARVFGLSWKVRGNGRLSLWVPA
jgi:hypothetical protein